MSDFRTHFGEQLTSASARLHAEHAQGDFRARLAVSLAVAATELASERTRSTAPSTAPPARARRVRGARVSRRAPAVDFRARLGAALTAASADLAAERALAAEPARATAEQPARARWLRSPAAPGFRASLGVALSAAAAVLAAERARIATPAAPPSRRRSPIVRTPRIVAARIALTPPIVAPRLALMRRLSMRRISLLRISPPIAIALSTAALAGGATAAALWLPQLGNSRFPSYTTPGASATAPPSDQLHALAVLRRTQSPGEQQDASVQAALKDVNAFTSGVRTNYVRVLGTTSTGESIVLVPVVTRAGDATEGALADALCVYYPTSGGDALGNTARCWSTEQVEGGTAVATLGGHLYGLVPDGHSSVTVSVAGAAPTLAAVTNNFFDVKIASPAGAPPAPPAVTFSAS